MPMIIEGGNDVFAELWGGSRSAADMNFFASSAQMATAMLSGANTRFAEMTSALIEKVQSSDAARVVKAALRAVGSMWDEDIIHELRTIGQIQHAGITMQRYIMANPMVRDLYHNQLCDGYSETYVDSSPGVIGEKHYDYRRVMNGIVVECEERGWYSETWLDDVHDNDRELELVEQIDILNTWERVEYHLKRKAEDPTSKWCNNL